MVFPTLIAVAVLAVGAYFLVVGGRDLRTVYHIIRNDPVDVRQLHGYTGPVEIEGQAIQDEDVGTVTAPVTGTTCLAYEYDVAELRSSGKHSNWETLDEGGDGAPFLVEDETGRVRIDPTGAHLRLEEETMQVSPGEELPDDLASYVAEADEVDEQDRTLNLVVTELHVGNEQRFTERRLDVGEAVYVYGAAQRGSAPEWGSRRVDAVVRDGDDAPVFVISDTSERGTAWRFATYGVGRIGAGFVLLGFGMFVLLSLL